MKVNCEKTENKNEVKLTLTFDSKEFQDGMKSVYEKSKKYFNVPGFRKGNVPMNIVVRYYGETIFYEDTVNELLDGNYKKAIDEAKIDVVSRPVQTIEHIGKDKDWVVSSVVSTKPEVKLDK